jgi:DNA-binding beta-propeller fold protein YncE
MELPSDGDFAGRRPKTLIDAGLRHPQGIAVDHKRKRLYVADPDVQKIYSYQLVISDDGKTLMTDGRQQIASSNAESRWVTVDDLGNLFFSDEPRNLILKISAPKLLRGDHHPEVVYNGRLLHEVSKPGGVAVDNFHLYWTNKHFGTQEGSLVAGLEHPSSSGSRNGLHLLSDNAVKSYGVCLALGNVYYTNDMHSLYGVKKEGGAKAVEITGDLDRPRGCAWDGDGTVFVADRGNNAVYSFAGNMDSLGATEVTKAFDAEDAFGLSVLMSGSKRLCAFGTSASLLVASAILV